MSNSPDHSWSQYGPSSSQSILSLPSSTCGSTSSSWPVAAGSWERTEGLPPFCWSLASQGRGSQAVLWRELWRPWRAVRLIPLWCHQMWEWPRWELKDESQTESVRPEIQWVIICVIHCLFYYVNVDNCTPSTQSTQSSQITQITYWSHITELRGSHIIFLLQLYINQFYTMVSNSSSGATCNTSVSVRYKYWRYLHFHTEIQISFFTNLPASILGSCPLYTNKWIVFVVFAFWSVFKSIQLCPIFESFLFKKNKKSLKHLTDDTFYSVTLTILLCVTDLWNIKHYFHILTCVDDTLLYDSLTPGQWAVNLRSFLTVQHPIKKQKFEHFEFLTLSVKPVSVYLFIKAKIIHKKRRTCRWRWIRLWWMKMMRTKIMTKIKDVKGEWR